VRPLLSGYFAGLVRLTQAPSQFVTFGLQLGLLFLISACKSRECEVKCGFRRSYQTANNCDLGKKRHVRHEERKLQLSCGEDITYLTASYPERSLYPEAVTGSRFCVGRLESNVTANHTICAPDIKNGYLHNWFLTF